jgi:hypothetical protein
LTGLLLNCLVLTIYLLIVVDTVPTPSRGVYSTGLTGCELLSQHAFQHLP